MSLTINRRSLLASGAAMIAAGATTRAQAQAAPELRFSAVFSEADIRAEMMKRFTESVKSDFTVETYLGGNLFKQGTEIVAMQRGNLEMGNIAPQDISEPDPGLVDRDLGLSVPRRRPSEEGLRQRCRHAI